MPPVAICLLAALASGPGAAGVSPRAQVGRATFVAKALEGKTTASGEIFHNTDLVAAHPRLPLGTVVSVTNLENGKSVAVRIVDRMPKRSKASRKAIIDLSRAAARALGFGSWRKGVARVRVEVIGAPTPRSRRPGPETSRNPAP